MNKPIMDIFGEIPLKRWMKIYANFIYSSDEIDTVKRQRIEDDRREFNLRVRKTNRGYVLAEGKWEKIILLKFIFGMIDHLVIVIL